VRKYVKTDSVTVDFDLPFPIHVSDQPFDVDVKGTTCELQFQKITRDSLDPRLRLGGGDFDLDEDRFGWVRYSTVNVSIPLNQLPPPPSGIKHDEWPVEIAISAVNNFLAHYRDLLNASWIRRMNSTEVWASDVTWFKEGVPKRTVSHRRLHKISPVIASIDSETEGILRQRLKESQPALASRQLLLDAEEALSRGDTALAVILGQIVVEGAVTTLLIWKCHQNKPSLDEVRSKLPYLSSEKALSYEAVVEAALVHHKLSTGLNFAIGRDISKDATLWYEWDVANSVRVACVHHGHKPSLRKARKALNTYRRVYHEYLEAGLPNVSDISADYGSDGINAASQALNQTPSERLCSLIRRVLPELKKSLLFYHIDRYPITKFKSVNLMAEDRGSFIAIWLDPNEELIKNEAHIARALFHYELIRKGYPYAKVADTLPDETTRTNWELFCEVLGLAVLGLPENKYLREAGFNIDELIQASFESTRGQLLAPDFADPPIHELDAWTFPLQLMGLYFGLDRDEQRQELVELVSNRASGISTRLSCLLKAIQEVGYETREDCVGLMVRCHNCFLALDSCLVIDPLQRLIYYTSGTRRY
jgi:hypothetical protein